MYIHIHTYDVHAYIHLHMNPPFRMSHFAHKYLCTYIYILIYMLIHIRTYNRQHHSPNSRNSPLFYQSRHTHAFTYTQIHTYTHTSINRQQHAPNSSITLHDMTYALFYRFCWQRCTPGINQINNSDSSVQIGPNIPFKFVPRDSEESQFFDSVDFGGVAFAVENGMP